MSVEPVVILWYTVTVDCQIVEIRGRDYLLDAEDEHTEACLDLLASHDWRHAAVWRLPTPVHYSYPKQYGIESLFEPFLATVRQKHGILNRSHSFIFFATPLCQFNGVLQRAVIDNGFIRSY